MLVNLNDITFFPQITNINYYDFIKFKIFDKKLVFSRNIISIMIHIF